MKAVVFDFNGTLFNDNRFIISSWQRFMHEKFGIDFSMEEVHRLFIGPHNATIFRTYVDKDITDEEVFALSREKDAMYREVVREKPENMQLVDGAEELFDLLTARNIPFGLATSSIIDNIEFYLNELGLKKWFTMERIVYDEGKLAPKPDPAFYLEAARRLNVDPCDCVAVEDSASGIQSAVNAGFGRVIAMDHSAPMDWLKSNPNIHAIVHDFRGFEKFL